MPQVHSFEPVIGRDPRVIILGSMPGVISLNAVQYYANPHNAFWRIMADLFAFPALVGYEARIEHIKTCPLILWDTLKACHREGSLDSKIRKQDIEANDICGLIRDFPGIQAIVFNGAASEKYFMSLVAPELINHQLELIRLPSTSPANAAMSFEQKLDAWRCLRRFFEE